MTSATNPGRTFRGCTVQPFMSLLMNGKVKNRTEMYAADLYVLMQREFRRRQTPACAICYVQLPFRADRRDERAANWEVVIPPPWALSGAAGSAEILTGLHQPSERKLDDPRRHAWRLL